MRQLCSYILFTCEINIKEAIYFREQPDSSKPSRSASDSEDDFDRQERERQEDLQERDELSSRLREKDKAKTRQVMSKTEKKVCIIPTTLS